MKNKKFRSIFVKILILVLVLATATTVILWNSKNNNHNDNQVTVTFETNGGNKVDPIKMDKGEKLSSLPQSYLAGSTFDGWYTDKNLTEEFESGTEINKNLTLYAGYTETLADVNVTETTSHYTENFEVDQSFVIKAKKSYGKEEFLKTIQFEALNGYLPWDSTKDLISGLPKSISEWFEFSKDGLTYTLKAKKIENDGKSYYAFVEGQMYKLIIPKGMQFQDLGSNITEYSFRIKEEQKDSASENVKYKNDNKIHYIKKTDIRNLKDITETKKEESIGKVETETTTFIKDKNENYNLIFAEQTYQKYNFEENDIICIGNGLNLDSESLFVKVIQIIKSNETAPADVTKEVLILATDAQINEVFDEIDINYKTPVNSDDIINSLNTDQIKKTVETNGSLEKVTGIMTNLLFLSDEVKGVYETDRTKMKNLDTSSTGLPSFCTEPEITSDMLSLEASLLKDAKVTVTIGKAYNPNFDKAYQNDFIALRISFEYSTTIKDRLEISSEIVFTQYLAASAQGHLNYEFGFFDLKWAEFDAAINLYSQTDFDFKILIRTTKPDGFDKNDGNKKDDDEDNGFEDIAEKISEKLNSEDGDDPDNIVAELKQMLDSENGYLELFKAPILRIPIDIIPGIPVMTFTVELDFLIEMNFAAGLSAHMSVLEAIQVGVTGDTRNNTFSSYQHDNLPGGNQYALQLSACGYLGIRAGFKGGLSLSFCGLSSFGKVGVYIFAGPYVDIYGFAQATLIKETVNQKSKITQSLVGGYYIEIGIFIDITLEARSDVFGKKVGTSLYNKKWPLVTFGNKEVLVSIETKDVEETIYIENKGENTASIPVDKLPKLVGTYLDITTGESTVKEVPWGKVGFKINSNNFKYEPNTLTIEYQNYSNPRPASETCVASYYYAGSILQFNMTSAQYKDYYPFATTKIVYFDSTRIDKEDAGKTVTAKFYTNINGKKEFVEEYKVPTGNTVYDSLNYYPKLDPYKYDKISWNYIPYEHIITDDTEYICTAEIRQVYIAFIYLDLEKNEWVTEIKPCALDEVPVAPEVKIGGKITGITWYGYNGVNCKVNSTPSVGIGTTISVNDMWERGYFIETTSGKDPTKPIATYTDPKENNHDLYYNLLKEEEYTESGNGWYYAVTSIYVAKMHAEDCTLTIHSTDINSVEYEDKYSVSYGRTLTSFVVYSPLYQDFAGFALTKGGEIKYRTLNDIPELFEDLELYAIYEQVVHEVNLYYYDSSKDEYVKFKTTQLKGGELVSNLAEDLELAKSQLIEAENIETEFLWFSELRNGVKYYLPQDLICARPLDIYPHYSRNFNVTFDSGEGVFPNNLEQKQIILPVESKLNYNININIACFKAINKDEDYKYRYEFVGWKNETTGEISKFENTTKEITINTKYPTTFTAVYEKVERTDYSIKISTEYGTLKNGTKEINKQNITYEEFTKLKNEYINWLPEDIRDETNKCTIKNDGISTYEDYKTTTFTIVYLWTKVYDRFEFLIDVNGGNYDGIVKYLNIEFNTPIDLSEIIVTKVDEYGTWKMKNWTDSFGNTYDIDDIYYVNGAEKITLNWEIETYNIYTITYRLDGKEIKKEEYHKGDPLTIEDPIEAQGKVFSGWQWFNQINDTIEPLKEMPGENLTLRGTTTEVWIKYFVDDVEIMNYVGKVGTETSVEKLIEKEGYTVEPWQTTDVTVDENGKFIMPKKDVVFKTTTKINSYKVTFIHNNETYLEKTITFGDYVLLPTVPTEEQTTYTWTSQDVILSEIGFYMPAKHVTVNTMPYETKVYIIYYINDEIISYETKAPNEQILMSDVPTIEKYNDMTFSGWYTDVTLSNDKKSFTVPQETVHIYGYFTKGTTKVNIYFSETSETPDLIMYGNENETINLNITINNKEISGYKINNQEKETITISKESEINAYVVLSDCSYTIEYKDTSLQATLPELAYAKPNEIIIIEDLPTNNEHYEFIGWYIAGVEILTNEENKQYFIMPEKDVIINLKYNVKATLEEELEELYASVYIDLQNSEPLFYQDYLIYSKDAHIYFDYPTIEGYEFIGFTDGETGFAHDSNGITYDDMNGTNRSFYAKYRKLELHVAEFRINNQVVGYQTFYDTFTVTINSPTITLSEGEKFTGWNNLYIKVFNNENSISFTTGERYQHTGAKKDFIFEGYIYQEENSYQASLIYQQGEAQYTYDFDTNLGSTIKLNQFHNAKQVEYQLFVNYTLDGETEQLQLETFTLENREYLIVIPTLEELKTLLTENVRINNFEIKMIDSVTE